MKLKKSRGSLQKLEVYRKNTKDRKDWKDKKDQ
jgi:hypothetical protein